MQKDPVLESLAHRFSDVISHTHYEKGESTIVLDKSAIREVGLFCRDDSSLWMDSLRDICGVDYFRAKNRYEVVYNLYSLKLAKRLRIKVPVDESDLVVPTVVEIWPAANWYERETFDMFGIVFEGHPDLRRIYMPEEFEHYPLRKDFPLMGIPGSLTLPRK